MRTPEGGRGAGSGKRAFRGAAALPACFFLGLFLLSGCSKTAPEHPIVTAADGQVVLPLELVGDGNVHFFTYKYEKKNVNFLIRADGNGRLHAHFDACYACFKYKMGFYVDGDEIVCRACRYRYKLESEFWDFIGPCAPIPLKHKMKKEDLVIDVSVLERGSRFF